MSKTDQSYEILPAYLPSSEVATVEEKKQQWLKVAEQIINEKDEVKLYTLVGMLCRGADPQDLDLVQKMAA